MNLQSPTPAKSSSLPWFIAVGSVTFALGIGGALTLSHMNQSRQNDAIALLASQLADIQVTRAQTPDLMAITVPTMPVPAVAAIPSASSVLAARVPTGTTQEVSQELKTAQAIAIANRNKMRMLTTAAANGDIQVPGSISASGGTVDSQTLLFDLVQRSLEDGSDKEIAAAQEMRRRAFAASAAKTEIVAGQRYYTVEAGDSLAYISLQFYGSTNAYDAIYQANRSQVASPDKIQIGQRLVIPEA